MFNTFIISLKLNNTCKVNKMINILRNTVIGNKFSNDLYVSKGIKIFGWILSFLKSFIGLFVGKIILVFIIYLCIEDLASQGMLISNSNTFIHTLLFLIIGECFVQSNMFEDGEEKYYSIILLKMDAKKYILANYYWKMFLRLISLIPALIILGKIVNIPVNICVLISLFSVLLKTIFNSFKIDDYTNKRNIMQKLLWPVAISSCIVAIVFPILNITISIFVFKILYIIVFIMGIYSFYKIGKFNNFYEIYRKVLIPESRDVINQMKFFNVRKENKVNIKKIVDNKEHGFKYLNSLFISRYRNKLYLPILFECLLILLECITIVAFGIKYPMINKEILFIFAFSLLIIFGISNTNGNRFLTILFKECDYAMLTFKCFRTDKAILELFKERCKILFKMNVFPALIMAVGLLIFFGVTGSIGNFIDYFVTFISVIAISINATINTLFMYYIIQPYTYNEILKEAINTRPVIDILNIVIYMVVLLLMPMIFKLPILLYGLVIILVTIINSVFCFFIVRKFAKKTFKVRL